jgi:hypothetical protein
MSKRKIIKEVNGWEIKANPYVWGWCDIYYKDKLIESEWPDHYEAQARIKFLKTQYS